MKNTLILTFLNRYWALILFAVFATAATFNERIFQAAGSLLYIPAVFADVVLLAYLGVHLIFRKTIDADAHGTRFVDDWNALTPFQRQVVTAAYRIGTLLTGALIALGIAK